MLKGCQKNIVHLKNTGSPYFEEAYFILNEKRKNHTEDENNLVKEANRIIEDNLCQEALEIEQGVLKRVKRVGRCALIVGVPFIVGLVFGAIITIFLV